VLSHVESGLGAGSGIVLGGQKLEDLVDEAELVRG
jgi:hypothetical protein